MSPGFIIDGYNLIYQVPDLAGLVEQNLEQARDSLVTRLAGFRGRKRIRVVLVFDGDSASGQPGRLRSRGVEIVFSRTPEKADERIVKMVRALKHPKAWTMVSSDRWIVDQCRSYGVKTVRSEEFARLLASPGRTETQPEKPEMKPGDVAEWEEYFRKYKTTDDWSK